MAFIAQLKRDFERLASSDRLAHGYLFFGENEENQVLFAKSLASYIETRAWQFQGTLIDALFLSGSEAGIGVVRTFINFLWQKPVASLRRIMVIVNADQLTIEAQNAILKIAEEPPEHALFLMTARDPSMLIWPLASRFQKIFISGQNDSGIVSEEAKNFYEMFWRAPTGRERSEIIKAVLEQESSTKDFIKLFIHHFRKNPKKNPVFLKDILHRWLLMNQYNTNRKLQLEAALLEVKA